MDGTAVRGEAALAVDEASLSLAAATGDGGAFATLCERYEQGAFNFAYRIVGAESDAAAAVQQGFSGAMRRLPGLVDGDPAFRPLLFSATRDACYSLLRERRGTPPSEAVPGEEIREAAMRLPEHQREALALRELVGISRDEMATIMEMSRSSVAQLISRARINLHDELRGNVLASVAAPSSECERALPLIAARDDGQIDATSRDAAWLEAHVAGCGRCRLGVEVMQEAAASYRAWAPVATPPGLLKATMAMTAEPAGADWSEEIAAAAAKRGTAESPSGAGTAHTAPGGPLTNGASAGPDRDRPRRRMTLAAGLASLLLLAGVTAAVFAGDDPPATSVDPAAGSALGPSGGAAEPANAGKRKGGAEKTGSRTRSAAGEMAPAKATAGETTSAPAPIPPEARDGGATTESPSRPDRSSGRTAVKPTQPTSTPRPSAKPEPAPASTPAVTSAPQPAPAPAVEEPPLAEESPGNSSGRAEPPGKPADRPPK